MSQLSLLADTSVCVLDRVGMALYIFQDDHSISHRVMVILSQYKRKNPEAKDYGFLPLFKCIQLGAKLKADWIFWAFVLMGQWKGKNMKSIDLRE